MHDGLIIFGICCALLALGSFAIAVWHTLKIEFRIHRQRHEDPAPPLRHRH